MTNNYTICIDILNLSIANQKDKQGDLLVNHCIRVGQMAQALQYTFDETVAAYLHDVLEDSDWGEEQLLAAGITPNAVSIIKEVTLPEEYVGSMGYSEYINSLCKVGTKSALRVKLVDHIDNSNSARCMDITIRDFGRYYTRYEGVRKKLVTALLARVASESTPVRFDNRGQKIYEPWEKP